MKRVVLQANVAIQTVAQIEVLKKRDGHFSPNLHHAGEKVGIVQIEGAVKAHGEGDSLFCVIHLQRGEMCVGQGREVLMKGGFLQVHTEVKHQVGELDVVDRGQGVHLENAWHRIGVFQLCEPGIGNLKFRIIFLLRDLLAQIFDVAGRNPQANAQSSQLVAWRPRVHGRHITAFECRCQIALQALTFEAIPFKGNIDILPAASGEDSYGASLVFYEVSSLGSSHNRLTSAEDNEEASLWAYPALGLLDGRSIGSWKEKRKRPYILVSSS
jgi:hypothetical protein